jgi:hypothetical protein
MLWFRETYPETLEGLEMFMRALGPDQVAVGVQSFVHHPVSGNPQAGLFVVTPLIWRGQIGRFLIERSAL